MIRLEHINKIFNASTPNENRLFENFNFEINKGDYIIVVGSNGSGKSTLLNLLAGTQLPDSGKILLDEKEITRLRDYQRSKYMARIFQNPLIGTAPDLTIIENFRLASLRTTSKRLTIGTNKKFRSHIMERIATLKLGLENKLDMPMGLLSGGQRQALTLLMATMDETQLLLLDEPTAALDPATTQLVMSLTNSIIQEFSLTALLVTHNMNDVIRHGNRVLHLDRGRIIHDLDMKMKSNLKIQDVFNWFGQ